MRAKISVLIVEDEEHKASRVISLLQKKLLPVQASFVRAEDYTQALVKLISEPFDLVIIDLLIPGLGKDPSLEASSALIHNILNGQAGCKPHIIGLTRFKEKELEARPIFQGSLLDLLIYDDTDEKWADQITAKVKYLVSASGSGNAFLSRNFASDILIVVARNQNEFAPIEQLIKWNIAPANSHHLFSGIEIRSGIAEFGKDDYRSVTIVSLNQMGITAASAITTQLVMVFKPQLVAMLGMCCGFNVDECTSPAFLGDVIVIEECSCWDEGKYDEAFSGADASFKTRAKAIKASDSFIDAAKVTWETSSTQLCEHLSKQDCWQKFKKNRELTAHRKPKPEIKIGTLLSGLSVISDAAKVKQILKREPSALGLDMETFGVYQALKSLSFIKPHFIAIKGVADFGIQKTGDIDFDKAQPVASALSYLVFKELVTRMKL